MNDLPPKDTFVSRTACRLHYQGRRRAEQVRLGVAAHLPFPGPTGPTNTIPEGAMTWTKPEAEVVAVTMEVTAYVATL